MARDPIARREPGHVGPNGLDDAGPFLSEYVGQRTPAVAAVGRLEVGVVEGGGGDPDQDLARPRLWRRYLFDSDRLRPAVFIDNRCFHV